MPEHGRRPAVLAGQPAGCPGARAYGVSLVLDATRISENALVVKDRERGYADWPLAEIVREIATLADAAVFSSQGIRESAAEPIARHHVGQVVFLGDALRREGVPIAEPAGAHAVFLDAKRFLPHLDQTRFPAQARAQPRSTSPAALLSGALRAAPGIPRVRGRSEDPDPGGGSSVVSRNVVRAFADAEPCPGRRRSADRR